MQKLLLRFAAALLTVFLACLNVTAQTRTFRPDDMFQLRRVGATAWAPNGQYVAIEFSKPSRWLDGVPANDLSLLDVKTGKTNARRSCAMLEKATPSPTVRTCWICGSALRNG